MNSEKVFNFRFLVPPSLTIFLIFILSPGSFAEFLKPRQEELSWLTGAIGIAGILSLGFIISTVANFIFGSKDAAEKKCAAHYKQIFTLDEFADTKNTAALELGSWMVLDQIDVKAQRNRHIIDQIHKRWNMAMANYNCAIALMLAMAVEIFLFLHKIYFKPDPSWIMIVYCAVVAVLAIIFLWNADRNRKSVLFMDLILAKFLEKNPS